MSLRKLIPLGGCSGGVVLPKGDLKQDGVVDAGEIQEQPVDVSRTGPGEYEVTILDEDLEPIGEREQRRVRVADGGDRS